MNQKKGNEEKQGKIPYPYKLPNEVACSFDGLVVSHQLKNRRLVV